MKKKCALCGDTCQTNIIFKFQRDSDNKVFHICGYCAENRSFHADELHEETTKAYTTVDSEFHKRNENGTVRKRATMTSHYQNKSNLAPKARPINRNK